MIQPAHSVNSRVSCSLYICVRGCSIEWFDAGHDCAFRTSSSNMRHADAVLLTVHTPYARKGTELVSCNAEIQQCQRLTCISGGSVIKIYTLTGNPSLLAFRFPSWYSGACEDTKIWLRIYPGMWHQSKMLLLQSSAQKAIYPSSSITCPALDVRIPLAPIVCSHPAP